MIMQASALIRFKLSCRISLALISTVLSVRPGHTQTTPATASVATPAQGPVAGAQAQQPGYTLKLNTQLVTLDVVVNDKNGQPIRGLTRNDFVIYEDKAPQPIVSFEATEPESTTSRPPIQIHSTAELDRLDPDAPVSIVVLDELTTRFEDQYFARYSLEKYLGKQGETLDQPLMLIEHKEREVHVALVMTVECNKLLSPMRLNSGAIEVELNFLGCLFMIVDVGGDEIAEEAQAVLF